MICFSKGSKFRRTHCNTLLLRYSPRAISFYVSQWELKGGVVGMDTSTPFISVMGTNLCCFPHGIVCCFWLAGQEASNGFHLDLPFRVNFLYCLKASVGIPSLTEVYPSLHCTWGLVKKITWWVQALFSPQLYKVKSKLSAGCHEQLPEADLNDFLGLWQLL